jgi:23S rRNA (pseudouridine1915-N3)-methyltransferase
MRKKGDLPVTMCARKGRKQTVNLQLLCIGKCKEKYLQQGCAEFSKRIQPYAKLTIVELAEEKAPEMLSAAERAQLLEREAARLTKRIKPDSYVIALAIVGEQLSSPQLADKLAQLATHGRSHFTFIIGSSYGLAPQITQQADFQLSFSALTFPHQLMRLILLEQLYRACKINRGETYHK